MIFGLLGEKLGHSFSPQIHKALGGYDYSLFEVPKDDLDAFMKAKAFDAINVTIPYKKAVIPYCVKLSAEAEKIGSVNTIKKMPDGSLFGYNTDYDGFRSLGIASKIPVAGRKIIVLGDGGAAPAVRTALSDLGAGEIVTISRKGENNYENIQRNYDAQVIVNTTPVGMYPKNGESLLDLDKFTKCEGILDIVYNPLRTKLVMDGEKRGIPSFGGLLMLVSQAKRASEIFTDSKIPDEMTFSVYEDLLRQTENVILIGMPGCGKSTIGRLLSEATGRELLDIDSIITENIGMTIPEFFAKYGEAEFRKKETEALGEACKLSGKIIATGGGVVTQERNYPLLRQNGRIFFIDRPLSELSKKGRPISQARPIEDIAAERMPAYISWSDERIPMETSAKAAEIIGKRCGL